MKIDLTMNSAQYIYVIAYFEYSLFVDEKIGKKTGKNGHPGNFGYGGKVRQLGWSDQEDSDGDG